jgi:uncharacterized membrane protein
VRAIAVVTRHVVIADWIFTATTVVFQPLSGWMMMLLAGIPWTVTWIWLSLVLYVVAGVCWLPVVWIQMQMRAMANEAAVTGAPMLPARYWRYARGWSSASRRSPHW